MYPACAQALLSSGLKPNPSSLVLVGSSLLLFHSSFSQPGQGLVQVTQIQLQDFLVLGQQKVCKKKQQT